MRREVELVVLKRRMRRGDRRGFNKWISEERLLFTNEGQMMGGVEGWWGLERKFYINTELITLAL